MTSQIVYFPSTEYLKALDDSNYKIGGLIVAFGLPKDSQGEYFDADTEFHLDWYNERPVLWHHGLSDNVGAQQIGTITEIQKTDKGLWAEAVLDSTLPIAQRVYELVKEGKLGWSSGSIPHLVKVASDGKIVEWPLVEASLTPNPAEPTRTTALALKAEQAKLINQSIGQSIQSKGSATMATDTSSIPAPSSGVGDTQRDLLDALIAQLKQATSAQASPQVSIMDALETEVRSTFRPASKASTSKVDLLSPSEVDEIMPEELDVEQTLASVLAVLEQAGAVEVNERARPPEDDESETSEFELPDEGLDSLRSDMPDDDENADDMGNWTPERVRSALKRLAQYVQALQMRYRNAKQRLDMQEAAFRAAGKTTEARQVSDLRRALDENLHNELNGVRLKALRIQNEFLTNQVKLMAKRKPSRKPFTDTFNAQSRDKRVPRPTSRPYSTSALQAPAVVTSSPFSNLSPQAMSFAAYLLRSKNALQNRVWMPSETFLREFSAKAYEAYKAGNLFIPDKFVPIVQDLHLGRKSADINSTVYANFGAEFIEESWRQEIWRKPRFDNPVAQLLRWIDMPTDPYRLPIEGVDPVVYAVPETTQQAQLTHTSGNPTPMSRVGTANTTLTTGKLKLYIAFSRELQEDSVADWSELILSQAMSAMEDAREFVILNADDETGTTNVNNHGAPPPANAAYMYGGGDGFVTVALANNRTVDMGGAKPTLSKLRELRMRLGRVPSQKLGDLVYIVDPYTYTAMLGIEELNSFFMNGETSTVLTGQVARIDGIPVVVTNQLYNAAPQGYVSATATNNQYGRVLCVYLPDWMGGYMRRIETVVDYDATQDAYRLNMYMRMGIVHRSNESVALLRNVSYQL